MQIARSFDINRPGARPSQLKGGIIGGSIIQGTFSVDDEVIIAPGRRITKGSKQSWEPIETKIISMKGGGKDLGEMHAGGLCGIATPLDPTMTKADNLTGQVMARKGELPPVWDSSTSTSLCLKEWLQVMKEVLTKSSLLLSARCS